MLGKYPAQCMSLMLHVPEILVEYGLACQYLFKLLLQVLWTKHPVGNYRHFGRHVGGAQPAAALLLLPEFLRSKQELQPNDRGEDAAGEQDEKGDAKDSDLTPWEEPEDGLSLLNKGLQRE